MYSFLSNNFSNVIWAYEKALVFIVFIDNFYGTCNVISFGLYLQKKHINRVNMKNIILAVVYCGITFTTALSQDKRNLVPSAPSKVPDYFCTWNVQGYSVSYESGDATRKVMNEAYMFGKGEYQDWINLCYPTIRQDLYFVMDDSWDIPQNVNSSSNPYLGTVEPDLTRFPSLSGSATERLRELVQRVKKSGWKGLGGWICAQKPENRSDTEETIYWTERLKVHNEAGFSYWKVDWGMHSRDWEWRKKLSELGRKYAPNLCMEHACRNDFIEFSDVFRTYDVENVVAQPVTIQRICDLLPYRALGEAAGLINCEDEPYIAAGLGCTIGVMRHPFGGNLPDGTQDITFPPVGRNIKRRIDEVIRGVRWHRIAEPFGVDGKSFVIDDNCLVDYWILQEKETWNKERKVGEVMTASAPARVSRGMPLPEVSDSTSADRPFILASRYPNGATAVASIGRALGRRYVTKEIGVTFGVQQTEAPIGLFGRFSSVTIMFAPGFRLKDYEVYAQDLAGNIAQNITRKVRGQNNEVIISGELLAHIGLSAASENDLSDPGVVIRFFKKSRR